MPSFLKLLFIVILFYCPLSSSYQDEIVDPEEAPASQDRVLPDSDVDVCEKCKDLDMKMMILMGICGTGLLALLLVLGLVIYLHIKMSRAIKAGCCLWNDNQDCTIQSRMNPCLPSDPLKLCEECSVYRDFDPLPPCFCYPNEGL